MIRWQFFGTALALALAFGYAGVANLLLDRRARSPFEWAQSFVIGCAVTSALLFPFSLLFGSWALRVCLGLVAGGAVFEAVRLVRGERPALRAWDADFAAALRTPLGAGSAMVIAISFLTFAMLNARYGLAWDAFQIWATKAQVLFRMGRLGPDPMPPEMNYLGRIVNYPHAIPLYEALLQWMRSSIACLAGAREAGAPKFDFLGLKPIFPFFYLCLLIATWRGARSLMPASWALAATGVLAALPGVPMMGENYGAYVDLPLAAAMMTAWAGCLALHPSNWHWRSPAVWSLGALLFFKNEGSVLLVVSLGSYLLPYFLCDPRTIFAERRRWLQAMAPIALLAILRFGYKYWIAFRDPEFAAININSTRTAIARLPLVAWTCGKLLYALPLPWGLFWVAFTVFALWLLRKGPIQEKELALTGLLGVVAYSGVFLYTNWRPEIHIPNAFPRLLIHLAPVAAVTVVAGYRRAFHLKADPPL